MTTLAKKLPLSGRPQGQPQPDELVQRIRQIAIRGLHRMFLPHEQLFSFRVRRIGDQIENEGFSHRYTAITLIGLAQESPAVAQDVLHGNSPESVCRRLIQHCEQTNNVGDVALTLWAARALGDSWAKFALERLQQVGVDDSTPTVELSWALAALTVSAPSDLSDDAWAKRLSRALIRRQDSNSHLFAHSETATHVSRLRAHVCCFADLVYPIQALAFHAAASGSTKSLDAARRCADRAVELMGSHGEWWWHYDVRTGRVIEPYPVYSVHQDAMAPMALFALDAVAGTDHEDLIQRGLRWIDYSPQVNGSLIDDANDVIWRKVGRREPGKLSRTLQAAASAVYPKFRAPGVDKLFPPTRVDYECRPYHLGWILYAWKHYASRSSEQRGFHREFPN